MSEIQTEITVPELEPVRVKLNTAGQERSGGSATTEEEQDTTREDSWRIVNEGENWFYEIQIGELIEGAREEMSREIDGLDIFEGIDDDSEKERRIAALFSAETQDAFNEVCEEIRESVRSTLAAVIEQMDSIDAKENYLPKNGETVALQTVLNAMRAYGSSLYRSYLNQNVDPVTGLPTLKASDDHALRALQQGNNVGIGTLDCNNMGAMNSAFGQNVVDMIVPAVFRKIAGTKRREEDLIGRRYLQQSDEGTLNAVGITSVRNAIEFYKNVFVPALDSPVEVVVSEEDLGRMKNQLESWNKKIEEHSITEKHRAAQVILKDALDSAKEIERQRTSDNGSSNGSSGKQYLLKVRVEARCSLDVVNASTNNSIAEVRKARDYAQVTLEANLASGLQKRRNIPLKNPLVVRVDDEIYAASADNDTIYVYNDESQKWSEWNEEAEAEEE